MQKIKNILIFLFGILILVLSIYYLGWLLRPASVDRSLNAIKSFYALSKDSVDVIGYGSSHIQVGVDPKQLENDYNIKMFNYGGNWQNFNTTLLFIKDSLKYQSPKVILIETYNINSLLKNSPLNGEIYYTRALHESKEKQEYLKEVFGDKKERYIAYYVPLYAFHENWVNLNKDSFYDKYTDIGENNGFIGETNVQKPSPIIKEVDQIEIGGESIKILDEIMELSKEKNFKVIFITIPYQYGFKYKNSLKEYVDKHDCDYIDFFDLMNEINIDKQTDFYDLTHLNITGAKKVTKYIGEYLKNNYFK